MFRYVDYKIVISKAEIVRWNFKGLFRGNNVIFGKLIIRKINKFCLSYFIELNVREE